MTCVTIRSKAWEYHIVCLRDYFVDSLSIRLNIDKFKVLGIRRIVKLITAKYWGAIMCKLIIHVSRRIRHANG